MFTDSIIQTLIELQTRHSITALPSGTSEDTSAPYSRGDDDAFNDGLDAVLRDYLDVRHCGSDIYVRTAASRFGGVYPDGETAWSAYYDEAIGAFYEWLKYEAWEQFCEDA